MGVGVSAALEAEEATNCASSSHAIELPSRTPLGTMGPRGGGGGGGESEKSDGAGAVEVPTNPFVCA